MAIEQLGGSHQTAGAARSALTVGDSWCTGEGPRSPALSPEGPANWRRTFTAMRPEGVLGVAQAVLRSLGEEGSGTAHEGRQLVLWTPSCLGH